MTEPAPKQREEREETVRIEIDRWVALVMGDSSKAAEAAQGLHDLFRRTHSPEEPVGWRPIETVPTDGRMVLGLFGSQWIEGFYSMPDGTWHWHDGDSRARPPTHWQPLPEPPIGQPLTEPPSGDPE